MWKKFNANEIVGVEIKGDSFAPPTRWWNHFFLALWGWTTVAVFQVIRPIHTLNGYRIGYKPFKGPARVMSKALKDDPMFRMKIGHEDCIFFAIDLNGEEVPIELVKRTHNKDPEYKGIPLY
ncbi:MAG: hypothetical protein ABH820_02750 [Patescibacteria group bacterium]|nr:hypothetical protein [Patescibacteria group bacterium]MBU2509056.1 hypothetical protein [Patescibacteria group bacterium]